MRRNLLILLLFIVIAIIFTLHRIQLLHSKQVMTQSAKSKYLCDAHLPCQKNEPTIPKGVCMPGRACTTS